jgi:hypothetical protein
MKIIIDNLLIFGLIIFAFMSAFFFWAAYVAEKREKPGSAYFMGVGLLFLGMENLPYLFAYFFL